MTQSAPVPAPAPQWIEIGQCRVELDSGQVETKDGSRRITHQATQVLKALLDAAPEVCRREQLIDSVWGGNYLVANRAIPSVIYALRRALNDRGKPGLIRTVPRVGYRLASAATIVPPSAPARTRWWLGVAAVALAAMLLYAAFAPEIRIRVQRQAASTSAQPEPRVELGQRGRVMRYGGLARAQLGVPGTGAGGTPS